MTESYGPVYKSHEDIVIKGYVDIPLAGVTDDMKKGIIGRVRISYIEGDEKLVFDERTSIDSGTLESVRNAIAFAENYTGKKNNYFISFDLHTDYISGGSSGSSVALGMIYLLENMTPEGDMLITGEIDENGNMIQTGAIPLKIMTAGETGFRKIFIPSGQAKILIYEKVTDKIISLSPYYVVKEFDLGRYSSERYGMELNEIKNLREVLE